MRFEGFSLPPAGGGPQPSAAAAVLFFGLVPVLIGLLLGATRAGVAMYFPWSTGVLFWVASSVAVWACLYAGSSLAGVLLHPWRPPLWLILLTGAVLGSFVARHFVFGMAVLLEGHMLDGREPRPLAPFEPSWQFVMQYLQGWTGVYATWLAVGLIFDRWFGYPRYSRSLPAQHSVTSAESPPDPVSRDGQPHAEDNLEPSLPGTSASAPSVLDRLPARIGRNVLALQAEDHYVRVHTDMGSALVLARLSDAIESLQGLDGIRVHRSWWARKDAVEQVTVQGKGLVLTLSNGVKVPVSQAYKALARQAGLTPGGLRRAGA